MAAKQILVKHPETDGVAEVSVAAYLSTWRAKGFEVVEYDHEGDLVRAAEQYDDDVIDAVIVDEESEPVSGPEAEDDVPPGDEPGAPDVDEA